MIESDSHIMIYTELTFLFNIQSKKNLNQFVLGIIINLILNIFPVSMQIYIYMEVSTRYPKMLFQIKVALVFYLRWTFKSSVHGLYMFSEHILYYWSKNYVGFMDANWLRLECRTLSIDLVPVASVFWHWY